MFAKRLLSSIVLWAILLSVLFYLPILASALFCCLLSTIALWEFYDMLERGGMRCAKAWGIGGGICLSAGAWWFSVRHLGVANTFEVLLLVCLVIGLFLRQLTDRENTATIQTISNTVLGVIYVPWLFNFIPKIQYLYAGHAGDGPGWLLVFYLVAVTKFCDSGAYATGRLFGRHKMMPHISPNKTWEGLLGGLVVAMIASVTAFKYLEPRISAVGFGYADALALGLLLGLMSVLGDLSESLLKRQTSVKDSGEMLPGIGGALDLIDSLLFTAPVLYAYLILFKTS
ncbi:MAG: phosphatidate cytidylyltransferase [Verrucomicrobia bacterium]|nr:phosphatidate cytidylyltransferase [Verrucomicrobiota bacterium]